MSSSNPQAQNSHHSTNPESKILSQLNSLTFTLSLISLLSFILILLEIPLQIWVCFLLGILFLLLCFEIVKGYYRGNSQGNLKRVVWIGEIVTWIFIAGVFGLIEGGIVEGSFLYFYPMIPMVSLLWWNFAQSERKSPSYSV